MRNTPPSCQGSPSTLLCENPFLLALIPGKMLLILRRFILFALIPKALYKCLLGSTYTGAEILKFSIKSCAMSGSPLPTKTSWAWGAISLERFSKEAACSRQKIQPKWRSSTKRVGVSRTMVPTVVASPSGCCRFCPSKSFMSSFLPL